MSGLFRMAVMETGAVCTRLVRAQQGAPACACRNAAVRYIFVYTRRLLGTRGQLSLSECYPTHALLVFASIARVESD